MPRTDRAPEADALRLARHLIASLSSELEAERREHARTRVRLDEERTRVAAAEEDRSCREAVLDRRAGDALSHALRARALERCAQGEHDVDEARECACGEVVA